MLKRNVIVKKILLIFILSMNAVSVSARETYFSPNNLFQYSLLASQIFALVIVADAAIHLKKDSDLQVLPSHEALQIIPSNKERLELLEAFFSNKEQYLDINIALVCRLTNHYSYAKLAKMLNEARKLAESDNLTTMTMKHIENAKFNIEEGYRRKDTIVGYLVKLMNGSSRQTPIHEAGHAVALAQIPCAIIHHGSTEDRAKLAGFVSLNGIDNNKVNCIMAYYEKALIAFFCGGIAEQVFGLSPFSSEKMLTQKNDILNFINQSRMSTDMHIARSVIEFYHQKQELDISPEEIDNELVRLYPIAYQFIVEHKNEIDKVANLLIEKGSIEGSDIYDLLNIDKPLYDFESGPLPKNLENNYQYRGDYNKHQKEINDLDYKKNIASIFKQKQTPGNLFVNPLPQDVYEQLGNHLENSRVQETFAENNGESAIIEID
jgi:hypothetical protein